MHHKPCPDDLSQLKLRDKQKKWRHEFLMFLMCGLNTTHPSPHTHQNKQAIYS